MYKRQILLGSCCASAGLYAIATSYFPLSPHRVAAVFAAVALTIFYWFGGPIVLGTLGYFLSFSAPEWAIAVSRSGGVIGGGVLLVSSLHAEGLFKNCLLYTSRCV